MVHRAQRARPAVAPIDAASASANTPVTPFSAQWAALRRLSMDCAQ